MCKWGITKLVKVRIPADLSSTGKSKTRKFAIDYCIGACLQRQADDRRKDHTLNTVLLSQER